MNSGRGSSFSTASRQGRDPLPGTQISVLHQMEIGQKREPERLHARQGNRRLLRNERIEPGDREHSPRRSTGAGSGAANRDCPAPTSHFGGTTSRSSVHGRVSLPARFARPDNKLSGPPDLPAPKRVFHGRQPASGFGGEAHQRDVVLDDPLVPRTVEPVENRVPGRFPGEASAPRDRRKIRRRSRARPPDRSARKARR